MIVGVDHQLGAGFAVGANYVWRRYGNFSWNERQGITSADWVAKSFTPTTGCQTDDGLRTAASRCDTVTYYQPAFQQPTVVTLTNVPGYDRTFNGVELMARKRMSHGWMLNSSFSYNDTKVHFGEFPGAANQANATTATTIPISEDPTNRALRDGGQYDYLTSGSGIGNVYVNAKWLFKLSGLYQLPYQFSVSAFYNARQGYPFEQGILSPSRANGGNTVFVLLDKVGDRRLPSYQNLDFHVERPIKATNLRFVPSIDVFNLMNSNTVQAIRGTQNASNANQIQAIVAPRVVRFGVRVNW
jgi:hypothetical protein